MSESGEKGETGGLQSAPDFTRQALAHLQVQSDDLASHVQHYLDAPDQEGLQRLREDLQRFRNILVLLDKAAAVYVAEELLALLDAEAEGMLPDTNEVARVLLLAADLLSEHVSALQRDGSIDSALPLLPLVNDSRACRSESLLSDVLVLAAGIELPATKNLDPADPVETGLWQAQRQDWIERSMTFHGHLAQQLLDWWGGDVSTAGSEAGGLRNLADTLDSLADFCRSRDYLESMLPLFQAASLVASAIAAGELSDGPALRSLYAQLERHIHGRSRVQEPADLLPGDLLRNLLYYVAQLESGEKTLLELRRRFRLDRVRQAARINERQPTPTIGVGYHLSRAIRNSIAAETRSLRVWLEQEHAQGQTPEAQPRLVRLRVRLGQLEPVLTLMGSAGALACLQRINIDLKLLDETSPVESPASMRTQTQQSATDEVCQRLAESLLLLDDLLEQNARGSLRAGPMRAAAATLHVEEVYVDMAIDACLREARISLQLLADSLGELLPSGRLSAGRCHAVTQQLQQIDQVLQVLPLPEVSPLLRGLGDVLTRLQLDGRRSSAAADVAQQAGTTAQHEALASLLVSIDYYLGCVLQPEAEAGQLLMDAEDALAHSRALLLDQSVESAAMPVEADQEERAALLLPHLENLGEVLALYRDAPDSAALDCIGATLLAFRQSSLETGTASIVRLAMAAQEWFDRGPAQSRSIGHDQFQLLEDVHAVIPQLIDQWLGDSEDVRGFDELIARLNSPEASLGSMAAGALTVTSDEAADEAADKTVDGDLLPPDLDDTTGLGLDSTLQFVFRHECLEHLEALETSVRSALQPSSDLSLQLPTEQMLRALHALAGSAQTVDAVHILALVQPLQRAALARQREGSSFDAAETRYIGELLTAIRARLDNLADGGLISDGNSTVEERLPAFLARVIPGTDAPDSGLGLASNVRSLDDVFTEEAGELLDRLRSLVHGPVCGTAEIRSALTILHTIKGSARMAGRIAIADGAHLLEADIQALDDTAAQAAALKAGYLTLSTQLSQLSAQKSLAYVRPGHTVAAADPGASRRSAGHRLSKAHGSGRGVVLPAAAAGILRSGRVRTDSFLLDDDAFAAILDLATDVTVNQARLSDDLSRLREVYHDIESTAVRWRALPVSEHPSGASPAIAEMLADLEAARAVMRDALLSAEREQQQASRAAASLQQSMIRTRLVRVDELREQLEQVLKDAADMQGRQAGFELSGGEVTLDRALFRKLQAPLAHLARNALVHGIECEADRLAAGKPATGSVKLYATIDGTDLVLHFEDDGRGIDRAAVNRQLAQRREPAVDTHEELQALLFRSGFSSVETPTPLAGHGLGLAAVQSAAEQLGGRVQLATQSGRGTRISLRIPQRIVVNQVVLVENDGVLFAIPVSHVEAVLMAGSGDQVDLAARRRITLSRLLLRQADDVEEVAELSRATILIRAAGHSLALEIDQVIGYRELVTQALGPQMATLQCYAGGSLLSDGRQVLILDMPRVVESLDSHRPMRVRPAPESLRPVALVVDDSLTMRTAARNVLQQCGIAVRQSRDGVEALESMATALPNLILLDIEMPRLDGLGFLRLVRETYGAACPPVIVISSRGDEANRERMQQLGVEHFLVKPYTRMQLHAAIEAVGIRLPDLTIA